MSRLVFHLDMDAFFASIEQARNPNLRGKPVIVGGSIDGRGVVSTCSYEARPFGVRSAMPIAQARRLCPGAIILEGDPEKYVAYSREILRLLRDFTPIVEPWSVDEAFLDMTETAARWGGALESGAEIKRSIRERFDLASTIGIAPSKLLSKMVSGQAKPDGLRWLRDTEVAAFLENQPVGELWGVGEKTTAYLVGLGIRTIGDLGRASRTQMGIRMGVIGERLVLMGRGRDDTPVVPYYEAGPPKSIGHETTVARDLRVWGEIDRILLALADKVARRMRVEGYRGRTVTAKIRFTSFRTITRRRTLGEATDEVRPIYAAARELVRAGSGSAGPVARHLASGPRDGAAAGRMQGLWLAPPAGPDTQSEEPPREPIRLLGISCSNLEGTRLAEVAPLLDESARARLGTLAVDAVRDRFGEHALVRARLIEKGHEAPRAPSFFGRPPRP
jgi:DNA polymerase-4